MHCYLALVKGAMLLVAQTLVGKEEYTSAPVCIA